MRTAILWTITALFLACTAPGCSSEGEIGEECGEEGVEDGECADGAICGHPGDESAGLACLKSCTDQVDCLATEECNGVSGSSTKGCRPKDTK